MSNFITAYVPRSVRSYQSFSRDGTVVESLMVEEIFEDWEIDTKHLYLCGRPRVFYANLT